jgi:hypothetical protein
MEPKGICLCKQETNVEDSSRTIVTTFRPDMFEDAGSILDVDVKDEEGVASDS